MKKNLAWITMTAVVAASPFTQAKAEEEVPFEACRNVVIYKTQEEKEKAEAKGCKTAQYLATPGIGARAVKTMEVVEITNLLGYVGEKRVIPDLKARVKYWEEVKACFDSKSPSADCQKQMSAIQGAYGGFVGALRNQLAQTALSGKSGSLSVQPALKPYSDRKLPFIPNAYPDAVLGDLKPAELKVANDEVAKKKGDLKKLQDEASVAYTEVLSEGVLNRGLYLVSYLPKPSTVGEDGVPQWDSNAWSKTVEHLIKDAKTEIEETEAAVHKGGMSVPTVSSTNNFFPGWTKHERDLMYIATLTPEMEKHLKKNPQDCGKALAAVEWTKSISNQRMAANLASFAVGGALAKLPSSFAKLGTAGKIVYGAGTASGGVLGIGMLAADHHHEVEKADKAYRDLAKIGVENGKEADIADPKKFAEAQEALENYWLKNGAITAAFLGGGYTLTKGAQAVAPYIKPIANAMVSKSKQATKDLADMILHSDDPVKFTKELEKAAAQNPEWRSNLAPKLVSDEVTTATQLKLEVRSDLKELRAADQLNSEQAAQIENMLKDGQPTIIANLEHEGKCLAETCKPLAIRESGKLLRRAKKACPMPKGGKK